MNLFSQSLHASCVFDMGNVSQKSFGPVKCLATHMSKNGENSKKLVVISGCDSGLGYSLSLKCRQLGFRVVSGCLDVNSEGAKKLAKHCHVFELDVTDPKKIQSFSDRTRVLTKDTSCKLHALVNNAGIMIFGEFEWLTERQVLQQVEVNLTGCFRMAKAFLPLLRKHNGRIINVSSHCALANLPSLSVYGATKAALHSWSDGLRLEQKKYGVKVVSFIPGSFALQSNIMVNQESHFNEMEGCFSPDDKHFYLDYFKDFRAYLGRVSVKSKSLKSLEDDRLYKKFKEALLSDNPKAVYKHEPWRYFFYYNAFNYVPLRVRDCLMSNFLKFPQYKRINR